MPDLRDDSLRELYAALRREDEETAPSFDQLCPAVVAAEPTSAPTRAPAMASRTAGWTALAAAALLVVVTTAWLTRHPRDRPAAPAAATPAAPATPAPPSFRSWHSPTASLLDAPVAIVASAGLGDSPDTTAYLLRYPGDTPAGDRPPHAVATRPADPDRSPEETP